LAGCVCNRDSIAQCVSRATFDANEICGVAYRKVLNGESTVAECCQAMERVQDCYAACRCDIECKDRDMVFCPTTGTVSDPI
ncbi:unnamed protein product, partial [Symbiodinium pilosum]